MSPAQKSKRPAASRPQHQPQPQPQPAGAPPPPPSASDDRLPPHSGEAEGGFLGCLLLDPDLVLKVGPVRGEWFYDLRHREVWLAMKRLADRRDVVDLITLQNELRKAKLLDQVGGLTFLANLSEQTPNAANWSYYLEIIREKFALRKTMAYCSEVVARVYAHEGCPRG